MELFRTVDWRGIKLKIWGSSGWKKTPFSQYYMGRPIVGAEMYFAYAHARIVINVHYGFKISDCPHYTGINHRVFETGGIGAFSLVNHQGDMDTTFETRLPTFEDYSDLRDKIAHFLQSPDETVRFTEDFKQEILARHTLIDRVQELKRVAMG
jgi:spore maturation protein CgeB